jgi:hypothetical protein
VNRSKLSTTPFMAALYALASGRWMGRGQTPEEKAHIAEKRQNAATLLSVLQHRGHHGGKNHYWLPLAQKRKLRKRERMQRHAAQRRVRVLGR